MFIFLAIVLLNVMVGARKMENRKEACFQNKVLADVSTLFFGVFIFCGSIPRNFILNKLRNSS